MTKKAPLIGLLTLILVFLVAFKVGRLPMRGPRGGSSVSGSTSEPANDISPVIANPELATRPAHEAKVLSQFQERNDSVTQHIKRTAILDPETKNLMLNCARRIEAVLTVHSSTDFQTLTEYLDKSIDLAHGRMIRVLQSRNIHLLSASGQRLRLSIQPSANPQVSPSVESSDPARFEIHLSGQADDGVYGTIALPKELKGLSVEQTVARFKSEGQVVYEEVSETRAWGKKIAAHVIYKNGQVENLEVFTSMGSLVCARIAGEASAQCGCRN